MMLSVLMFPGRLDADLVLNKEIWVGWIEGEQPSSGIGSSPYGVWNAAGGSGQTAQQSDVKSKRKARVFRWGSSDLPSYDSSAKKKMEKKYNKELERKREKSKEEIVIWLDGDDGTPVGIIVKKIRKGDEKGSTG